MKKFLLYILLFFGIVVVVDLGFGYACEWLQNHAKGGSMKSIRQTANVQTADIVVMGSSRAHHHYVPSIISDVTGMSAYNGGVDGNGIVLASGLYNLMEERYTPRVIIYDVEPTFDINVYTEDGNNTRYIGGLRPYCQNPQVMDIICRVDPSERYKVLSSMFRYNGKIIDLLKDQVVLSDYTNDGYAPMQGEMSKAPEIKTSISKLAPDTLKLKMMEEFISRVVQSNTKLIVVASPKYGATTSEVFEPIKEICYRYGVEFWDYYTTTKFQKMEYFKESMHLNDKGAKAFSEFVSKQLLFENN